MSVFSPLALHRPASLAEAVTLLASGDEACALAGGTWIMRAPIRHETPRRAYVALSQIPELRVVTVTDHQVEIGASVTHAALAAGLAGCPDLQVLAQAAARSANPAIRAAATLGGNLCTVGFAAADLVPALLCLDAEVEIMRPDGAERLRVADFLDCRTALEPGWLLSKVVVARSGARSTHQRLPLRKAGDYPVAIVSLAVTRDGGDRAAEVRAAIGSVESVARRWTSLEEALAGQPLDPQQAFAAAERALGDITGRDGIEAPGWYRTQVLPALVRRAVSAVMAPAL